MNRKYVLVAAFVIFMSLFTAGCTNKSADTTAESKLHTLQAKIDELQAQVDAHKVVSSHGKTLGNL